MKPMYEHAYYLTLALRKKERKQTIAAVVKILRHYKFDAIAFRGMSGALIAPVIADRMGKTIIMVRKEEDTTTHSEKRVEGDQGALRYVIVDDLVSTGNTVVRIKQDVKAFAPKAVCIGVLEYNRLYQYGPNSEIPHGSRLQFSDEPYAQVVAVDESTKLTVGDLRKAVDLLKPVDFRFDAVSYSLLLGVTK